MIFYCVLVPSIDRSLVARSNSIDSVLLKGGVLVEISYGEPQRQGAVQTKTSHKRYRDIVIQY